LLQNIAKEDVKIARQEPQKVGNILGTAPKKDEPEDELESLEKKFEKIKKNFYQTEDGLFHVMDPVTKQWKTQTEAPNIEVLDDETLENLILGINNEGSDSDEEGKKKGKGGKNKPGKTAMIDLDTLTDEQIVIFGGGIRESLIFCYRKKWKKIKERLKSKPRKRDRNGIKPRLITVSTLKGYLMILLMRN